MVHTYNGILLTHKKEWNTVIWDNMDGSWKYHTKWNKPNGNGQERYDLTHTWGIKWKAVNEHTEQTDSTIWWFQREGGWGEDEEGTGAQIYGDRRGLDSGWWVHNAIHRWYSIELYTETHRTLLTNITPLNVLSKKGTKGTGKQKSPV